MTDERPLIFRDKRVRHGMRHTPEYEIWYAMLRRCNDPRNPGYPNYGGRGIKVCERWLSFENFIRDVGRRQKATDTLEREDNDGDYEPGNVHWAPRCVNNNNRRNNIFLEWRGKRMTIGQWARESGIKKATLLWRHHQGWTVEQILSLRPVPGGARRD